MIPTLNYDILDAAFLVLLAATFALSFLAKLGKDEGADALDDAG
jgi:hypothetical protein